MVGQPHPLWSVFWGRWGGGGGAYWIKTDEMIMIDNKNHH